MGNNLMALCGAARFWGLTWTTSRCMGVRTLGPTSASNTDSAFLPPAPPRPSVHNHRPADDGRGQNHIPKPMPSSRSPLRLEAGSGLGAGFVPSLVPTHS
jgi:hypothetical protein